MSEALIISVGVVAGCFVLVGAVYAATYLRQYFASKNQEEWRKQWRLTHTNSIRGNLVRTYEEDVTTNYHLDTGRQLGKGGCGVVISGHHKESGAEFAIKTVPKATSERGRLDREIKLLKDVDHANIVRLFEVYDTPTHVYFIMECCSGGHLGELLARQPRKCLEEDWARVIIRQLVSAVAHLHSRGICHRDIKLQNILMENTKRNAQIKLIDFGYGSRFIGALPMRTKCGTPYTTAPEVLRENYDQRCDVWSVGVVSFIVLAGKRPFEILEVPGQLADAGKAVMLTNILMGRFHYNPAQWSKVSPQALDFVDTLLHHDYKTRIQAEDALEHKWLMQDKKVNTKPVLNKNARSTRAIANMRRNSNASALRRTGLIALVFGLQPQKATDVRALFQSIDVDNSGSLSIDEFKDAMKQLAPELSPTDVQTLFDTIDIDGNHLISYTEFLAATLDPREIDLEDLNKAFRLLDADGNGFIDVAELETVLRTRIKDNASKDKEAAAKKMARAQKSTPDGPAPMLRTASRGLSYLLKSSQSKDDEASSEDDVDSKIKDILSRCDLNGDGLISYDEFLIAMTENGAYSRRTLEDHSNGVSPCPSGESASSLGMMKSPAASVHRMVADSGAVAGPSSANNSIIPLTRESSLIFAPGMPQTPDAKTKLKPGSQSKSFRSSSNVAVTDEVDNDDVGVLQPTASQRSILQSIGETGAKGGRSTSNGRLHAEDGSDDSYGTFGTLTASRLMTHQQQRKFTAQLGGPLKNLPNNTEEGFVQMNQQSPSNSPRLTTSARPSNIALYDGNNAAELYPGSDTKRPDEAELSPLETMPRKHLSSRVKAVAQVGIPQSVSAGSSDVAESEYNHDISAAEIVSVSDRDKDTNYSASTAGADRRKLASRKLGLNSPGSAMGSNDNNSIASNRCSVGVDASMADLSVVSPSAADVDRKTAVSLLRKGSISRMLGLEKDTAAPKESPPPEALAVR